MFYDGESFVLEDRATLFKYLQRNSIGYKPYVLFTSLCPFGIQNLFIWKGSCLEKIYFFVVFQVKSLKRRINSLSNKMQVRSTGEIEK